MTARADRCTKCQQVTLSPDERAAFTCSHCGWPLPVSKEEYQAALDSLDPMVREMLFSGPLLTQED